MIGVKLPEGWIFDAAGRGPRHLQHDGTPWRGQLQV